MTVHHARAIALAAVLIGISALVPSTRLHAQHPLDGLQAQAEQGDAEAQSTLGSMYRDGRSVPQDYAEAVRWFRLAAVQGDDWALAKLGVMYDNGQGVPQDDAEAVRWFHAAANQGDAAAQFNLGVMYKNGEGVPQDYVEAHMWFNLATAQSSGENRDTYVVARDTVAERISDQLAEAQRRAREWTPTPEP